MSGTVPGDYEVLNKKVSLSLSLEKGDTEGNGQILNLLMRGPKSKCLPVPPLAVSHDIALHREMLSGQQTPASVLRKTDVICLIAQLPTLPSHPICPDLLHIFPKKADSPR